MLVRRQHAGGALQITEALSAEETQACRAGTRVIGPSQRDLEMECAEWECASF